MKLTFQKKHLSIDNFNEVNLPDFVVLTGINGSGKSHLLEAIENKSVSVDNTHYPRIIRFDYRNFFLENEAAYNARQIIDDRNNAWNFFIQQNWKNNLASFKSNLGVNYDRIAEIAKLKNKPFLELSKDDIGDENIFQQYESYKTNIYNLINQDNFKGNTQAQSIVSVIKRINHSADDIEKDEFDEIFKPYHFKNDFLPNQLGKIIWDYYSRYRNNEVNEFQKEKYPDAKANYTVLSEKDFEKIHGKKPWVILNEILENFGTIEYRFPSPEGSEYFSDFQLQLVHKSKNLKLDFSSLSSGERVLMALIASIYKTSSDNHFPDVLLLDEIDASLHPSMIKNLLDAIQNVFLKRGTKIILVTHSPTTVALAPDESVYIMNKAGLNRIEKVSKNSAINILTEGFATLDEGLRIFDEISSKNISIISEGYNKKFIEEALRHNKILDVEVIDGMSWCGKTELRTIFEFLVKIPHPTKNVLIVWDSDVTYELKSQNNTHPFIFSKNEANHLAKSGIENLFTESLIRESGFIITTKKGNGDVIDEHFDSSKKKEFMEFVVKKNNKADFNNFQSLIDKTNELKQNNGATS